MTITPSNTLYLTSSQLYRHSAVRAEKTFEKAASTLSSEGRTQDYQDVSDISGFIHAEMKLESVEKYTQTNSQNTQRLQSLEDKLDQLQKITNHLQQEISLTRSTMGTPIAPLQKLAKGLQHQVTSLLNSTFSNEYLFSGTATQTPPVTSIDNAGVTRGGEITTIYYQGSQDPLIFNADSTTQMTINCNASHEGIAKLIYSLNLCAHVQPETIDQLGRANDLCSTASQDLSIVRAEVGTQINTLNQSQDALRADKDYLEESIQSLGYPSFTESFQEYMNALTSKDIAMTLLAKNDSIRTLIETLR